MQRIILCLIFLVFKNSTADGPWEKVQRTSHVTNRNKSISPGNPGPIMSPYSTTEINFCPLGSLDESAYNPFKTRRAIGLKTCWSEYSFLHGKVTRSEERFGRTRNDIFSVNDESENVAFVDNPARGLKAAYSNWTTEYEHYNASFSDGSARYIATDRIKLNYWLWGSANWGR